MCFASGSVLSPAEVLGSGFSMCWASSYLCALVGVRKSLQRWPRSSWRYCSHTTGLSVVGGLVFLFVLPLAGCLLADYLWVLKMGCWWLCLFGLCGITFLEPCGATILGICLVFLHMELRYMLLSPRCCYGSSSCILPSHWGSGNACRPLLVIWFPPSLHSLWLASFGPAMSSLVLLVTASLLFSFPIVLVLWRWEGIRFRNTYWGLAQ